MSVSITNNVGAWLVLKRFVAPSVIVVAGIMFGTASSASVLDGQQAPSGSYVNDPGHTRFLWRIEHLGLTNYTARINDVDIRLEFDANNIASSSVTAVIDSKSVDTGYVGEEDFDAKISIDENILNAAVHPTIEFASSKIVKTGQKTMAVTGDLTLLGVTRPVTLDVTLSGSTEEHPFVRVPALGFAATAVIDRTEFGLDFLSGNGLGDQIEIEIHAEFIRQ